MLLLRSRRRPSDPRGARAAALLRRRSQRSARSACSRRRASRPFSGGGASRRGDGRRRPARSGCLSACSRGRSRYLIDSGGSGGASSSRSWSAGRSKSVGDRVPPFAPRPAWGSPASSWRPSRPARTGTRGAFGRSRRPKSGVRSFCRSRPSGSDELLVVAPDYLAPTVWYYCGRDESTHGFVRWDRPTLFDPGSYAEPLERSRRRHPDDLADRRPAPAAGAVPVHAPVWTTLRGASPAYGRQIERLRAELAARFEAIPERRLPGRLESVDAVIMSSR